MSCIIVDSAINVDICAILCYQEIAYGAVAVLNKVADFEPLTNTD